MFSVSSYLNNRKNNQMVRAEKGDFMRSRNWSALKLTFSMEVPNWIIDQPGNMT